MYELQIVKRDSKNHNKGRMSGNYKKKKTQITKFKHIIPLVRDIIDHPQEHAIVISMDATHNVISSRIVHIGNSGECSVSVKDVFRGPMADNAEYMIFVHNHPNGTLDPSKADLKFTKQLCKVGWLLDILVIDSCIVSSDGVYSINKKRTIKVKKTTIVPKGVLS